jgi:hypothetical protein
MRHHIEHGSTWTMIPFWAVLLVLLTELGEARADGLQQGYTVSAEANPDSLGLVLPEGTWQIWLGDGCGYMRAGVNVMVDGTIDAPQLQIVDPISGVRDQVCQVTRTFKRSDAGCVTNPDGVCDVAWVR